ncbi:MAG TPA: SDR family NAD(P)-dependent oxidoreductase [Longimicrobiales bacterium]|nr:SDR family NAD(P)-dependent oxidoreductase [Longimicrobiales bacterium]
MNRKPLIDLKGKTALVTGGSRGVGRATALLLARAGADVGISFRSREDEARGVVEELKGLGAKAWAQAGDLSEPGDVAALFRRAGEEFPGLDFVVVNHGIWPVEDVAIGDMDEARWRRTVQVNLDGAFYVCREAARSLRDHGRIVLVGSTAGQRGEAFHGDYAATKGALISLVKGFCIELAPRDITVNCVAPGWIDTEMAAPALQGPERERVERGIPLGRVASADDVAGPIVFLCSELGRHVTGEVLNVNGGAVLVG